MFLKKYEEVKSFIIAQISDHENSEIKISVAPLPTGFAKLSIRHHDRSIFIASYPVTRGDESGKLLRIACEKSRQVLQGQVNLIILSINALGEEFDDFESALRRFEHEIANDPDRFAENMGYKSPSHAKDCWQACSAFLVRDAWVSDPISLERPILDCRTFLVHDCGQSQIYENLFAVPRLPRHLLELAQRSTQVPFRS